jgi:hypothetical protein
MSIFLMRWLDKGDEVSETDFITKKNTFDPFLLLVYSFITMFFKVSKCSIFLHVKLLKEKAK